MVVGARTVVAVAGAVVATVVGATAVVEVTERGSDEVPHPATARVMAARRATENPVMPNGLVISPIV